MLYRIVGFQKPDKWNLDDVINIEGEDITITNDMVITSSTAKTNINFSYKVVFKRNLSSRTIRSEPSIVNGSYVSFENCIYDTVKLKFGDFKNVKRIDLRGLTFSKITSFDNMFKDATNLEAIIFGDISNIKSFTNTFDNCINLKSITLPKKYNNLSVIGLTWDEYITHLNEDNITFFKTDVSKDNASIYVEETITSLQNNTNEDIDVYKCRINCASLFKNNNNIINVTIDVEEVMDHSLSQTFESCHSLENVCFDFNNIIGITIMQATFKNCDTLKKIELKNLDTSQVTTMADMFRDCKSLTSLDLSNFITTNCIEFGGMFYNCTSLKTLNISSFDTRSALNSFGMISHESVTVEYTILGNCNSLETLILGENCDASSDGKIKLLTNGEPFDTGLKYSSKSGYTYTIV